MAVIRRGASENGWFAVGEEGSSFFIPPHIFSQFCLHEGMEVSGKLLAELEFSCLFWRIRCKAVDLLSRREHSRQELRIKLQQRSYPPEVIEQVLDDLQQRCCLDDRRFAEVWVSSRMRRRPEGRVKLASTLASKGVSREIIDDVLRNLDSAGALEQAADKLLAKGSISREKLVRSLMRKGFSSREIMQYLQGTD